jgi:hypothetical protein
MSTDSTAASDWEGTPLVVKPKVAWRLLDCSNTRGYELLAAGELQSFKDGRSRKISVESIHRYIARRLALTDKSVGTNLAQQLAPIENSMSTDAQPRRRGRPPKSAVAERTT